MADISDVTAYLANAATSAVYPNGASNASVAAMDVRVFEGWPNPNQLDLDVAGKILVSGAPTVRTGGPLANVSIFPMLGMGAVQYQILDNTYVIAPAVFGLSVNIVNGIINLSGIPTTGEYVTVIADGQYVHSESGINIGTILSSLAADFTANYPTGVSAAGNALTIPFGHSLIVRQGAVATLGKVTHRQKQSVMISVWAPDHRARALLASAIDVAIKNNIKVSMPDTSQIIICYNRTNVIDEQQVATIYRRDLIYDVEYATVFQFPGYVITTVNTSIANYNNTAIAPAIT